MPTIDLTQIQNNLVPTLLQGTVAPSNPTIVPSSIYLPPVNAQVINDRIDNASTIASYSYPIERPKYYTFMGISEYSRIGNGAEGLLRLGTTTTEKIIVLPLPMTLVDAHNVDYEPTKLGALGGALGGVGAEYAGKIKDSFNGVNTVDQSLGSDVLSGLTKLAGSSVGAAAATGLNLTTPTTNAKGEKNILGGIPIGGVLQALTGYAPNEFLTILLTGPKYKQHQFTWILSPRNPTESEIVRKIIFILNSAMAPSIKLQGALFGFPKIFRLGFFPNSKMLYRFKPAVLESFTVDYAGAGQGPTFYRSNDVSGKSNAPETVAIRLQFLELEFWLNRDGGWEDSPGNDFANGNADVLYNNIATGASGVRGAR